jgi:hypothetical protein
MNLHINKFLDTVRMAESRGQRDIHLSLTDARDLQRDITKLLLSLEGALSRVAQDQPQQIEISGGSFRDS